MTVKHKILMVAEDADLRDLLAEQLGTNAEFVTEDAASGADALARASDGYYDMILLDHELSDMSGRALCGQLREAGVKAPIVMLSAANEPLSADEETIQALDAGANDVVIKPFRIAVLLARIRAHLREHEQSEFAVFTVGPYIFQPAAKILHDQETDAKIRLTDKETAIIKYLHLAGEKVVGRDVLLGEVWGYNAGVTTHTLETHVYRLRQKIERDPTNAQLLVTEPNGYRLNS